MASINQSYVRVIRRRIQDCPAVELCQVKCVDRGCMVQPPTETSCAQIICVPKKEKIASTNNNGANSSSKDNMSLVIGVSCGGATGVIILVVIISFIWWYIKNKKKIDKKGGVYNFVKVSKTKEKYKEMSANNSLNSLNKSHHTFYQDPVAILKGYDPLQVKIKRMESTKKQKKLDDFNIDNLTSFNTTAPPYHTQYNLRDSDRFINTINELQVVDINK
ncbi:hypothetical protein K502DRAFT_365936 [Neoconidiobolus thromboides FSU 785]|nr:hypothetical protein K502DRAFT_365936 [Neoconidiobolus thromboides FSU 785]